MKKALSVMASCILLVSGCIDPIPCPGCRGEEERKPTLSEVAQIISGLPLDEEHLQEVAMAVKSSVSNGYDEEYTMANVISSPGSGVGDDIIGKKSVSMSDRPLSDLIREHLSDTLPKEYMRMLADSDIQIYWPYAENWDGKTLPVITFDPENDCGTNFGYELKKTHAGVRSAGVVVVDEQMAKERPVWVINRNKDDSFMTVDMIKKLYPELITPGGEVTVIPSAKSSMLNKSGVSVKTMVLRDFTMHRNYDSWFAGASEFFVKCGAVEDFLAATEAEMKLYSPAITDFVIVVKRSQVGKPQPFNAILVSQWTSQLSEAAFMITEDDGGTRTSWKCTALVRVASKSYGIELDIPYRSQDDIVWRGKLSRPYLEATGGKAARFGDVSVTFEIQDI